ncbi:MAG: flagellar export chaperone FliS [Bythopirellula sp.]|nr:flagellar export chaperone FliS [Bythopirellula sp.]
MAGNTNSQYLESKVFTASQPRLHLMLIEGALRHCRFAQQASSQGCTDELQTALIKALDIVEELVNSVTRQAGEISQKLEEQYAFLFRELAACGLTGNLDKLDTCIKLLDFERETWKLVCDRTEMPTVNRATVVAPHFRADTTSSSGSFSFEA